MIKERKNILASSLMLLFMTLALNSCVREGLDEQLYVEFKTGFNSTDVTITIDGELLYQNNITTDTSGYAALFTTELLVGDYNISVSADTAQRSESFDLNTPLLIEVRNSDSLGLQFNYRELNVQVN